MIRTILSITKSVAISTLSLSAIKFSESSINSGNLGGGTGIGTISTSTSDIKTSIFARFAALAAIVSFMQ